MSKLHTPAMERIAKKNARRKKAYRSTPGREAWKRFKRNPTALVGLAVVIALFLIAVFAPLIAPYDYAAQDYTGRESCSFCEECIPGSSATQRTRPPETPV